MKKGKFKFLTLLNKYRSIKSEISYIKEVLDEAHKEFELYYRSWCIDNNVDIGELNKRNQRKIDMIFINEKSHRLKQELIAKEFSREKKEESKDAKDIFKLIARKLHPDTVSNDDPRKNEFEEDFKKAANANKAGKWGDLFDIVEKYKINLNDYSTAIECLEYDIKRISSEISKEKNSYSWLLFEAETEKEKEIVVKRFLKQMFGWEG